jgi:hypothetical protein
LYFTLPVTYQVITVKTEEMEDWHGREGIERPRVNMGKTKVMRCQVDVRQVLKMGKYPCREGPELQKPQDRDGTGQEQLEESDWRQTSDPC